MRAPPKTVQDDPLGGSYVPPPAAATNPAGTGGYPGAHCPMDFSIGSAPQVSLPPPHGSEQATAAHGRGQFTDAMQSCGSELRGSDG